MIDEKLLKQLGWSDELIAATTRGVETVRSAAPDVPYLPEMTTYSVTSSSLNVSVNVTSTNQGIYVATAEKSAT